jgi:hypothetical protein
MIEGRIKVYFGQAQKFCICLYGEHFVHTALLDYALFPAALQSAAFEQMKTSAIYCVKWKQVPENVYTLKNQGKYLVHAKC